MTKTKPITDEWKKQLNKIYKKHSWLFKDPCNENLVQDNYDEIFNDFNDLLTQATSKAREEALKLRKTEIELFEYLLQRHVDEGSYFGRKDQHYKMRDELLKKLQSLKKDK